MSGCFDDLVHGGLNPVIAVISQSISLMEGSEAYWFHRTP